MLDWTQIFSEMLLQDDTQTDDGKTQSMVGKHLRSPQRVLPVRCWNIWNIWNRLSFSCYKRSLHHSVQPMYNVFLSDARLVNYIYINYTDCLSTRSVITFESCLHHFSILYELRGLEVSPVVKSCQKFILVTEVMNLWSIPNSEYYYHVPDFFSLSREHSISEIIPSAVSIIRNESIACRMVLSIHSW